MPHPLDPTARGDGHYVPMECILCPPSYGWCEKHNRCRRHCACAEVATPSPAVSTPTENCK